MYYKNNMNIRANILYFIEHFIDSALKESHHEFVRMLQRDILRVVDAVAPPDGSGAANVKVVRKVLLNLQSKEVLQPETIAEIEECLKERETHPAHLALSPMSVELNGVEEEREKGKGRKVNGVTAGVKFDKRQIEQRIEEDRERNKRLREGMWAVKGEEDIEVGKIWEEGSDVGEDEEVLGEDEVGERLGMRE
jgi:CTD kinase subunit gamma